MSPEQKARILELHVTGHSVRAISEKTGVPRSTVDRHVQGVPSPALENGTPPDNGTPSVIEASLSHSLVGMMLSPKELLDAREAGALPDKARLDAWGRVEISDGPVLWPAYSLTGEVLEGKVSKRRYWKMSPEQARAAVGPMAD